MVDTEARTSATHPLQPLSVDEISVVVGLLLDGGRVGEMPVLAWVALKEPPKCDVLAWTAGGALTCRAVAVSVDRATGVTYESVVNLSEGAVEQAEAKPGLHAPVLAVEWLEATPAVLGDSRVQGALREARHHRSRHRRRRAVAGCLLRGGGRSSRTPSRPAILFIREHDGDTLWARPIEGGPLSPTVRRGRWSTSATVVQPPYRRTLVGWARTIPASVPYWRTSRCSSSPSPKAPVSRSRAASCDGSAGRCGLSVHPIDGLVLHQIAYDDPATGPIWPICYRASLSEMVVPYGTPDPCTTGGTSSTPAKPRSGRTRSRSALAATASVRCTTWTPR